jgi:hypothetical protein
MGRLVKIETNRLEGIKMEHDEQTIQKAKFCKDKCPVCKRARAKGKGFLYWFVKIERKICPNCKAYEKVFNKPAYE